MTPIGPLGMAVTCFSALLIAILVAVGMHFPLALAARSGEGDGTLKDAGYINYLVTK